MDRQKQPTGRPKGSGERLSVAVVQMSRLDDEPVNIYGNEFSRIIEELKNLNKKVSATRPKVHLQYQDTLEATETILKRVSSSVSELGETLQTADNLIWQRIEKSLRFARGRGANIIVFPELSIPWELLTQVDELCKELSPAPTCDQPLLVVAGTHYAEPAAKRTYKQLGLKTQPQKGSFAPVYSCWKPRAKKEWRLIPKLKPSIVEQRLGKDWPLPVDPVCRTIDFGNFKVAVLICSDFIDSPAAGEEFDGVSVILVPAYNENHANFAGSFKNHWTNYRKGVYANNSVPGNSKTTCTDRLADDSNPKPFSLQSGMYMVPRLNEAVMVHSILVGDKEIRDKLVALAPMIPSKEFPEYCRFYQKYSDSGKSKTKQVKRFKNRNGFSGTCLQVRGKTCYGLFSEKLFELDHTDPDNLCEEDLDLLVDVIPIDAPGRGAQEVTDLLGGSLDAVLNLAKVQDPETIRQMGELAAIIKGLKDAWEAKLLLTVSNAAHAARHIEARGSPPVSNENSIALLLTLLTGQMDSSKRQEPRRHKPVTEMLQATREIGVAKEGISQFESVILQVLKSLEEDEDEAPLNRFANLYERVIDASLFLGWSARQRGFFEDTPTRSETETNASQNWLEDTLESLSRRVVKIASVEKGISVFAGISPLLRDSSEMSEETGAKEIELSVLSRFLDTSAKMMIARLRTAGASFQTEVLLRDSEIDDCLLEAGLCLELIGITALRAVCVQACSAELSQVDWWSLAAISIGSVFKGRFVRRRIREAVVKLLDGEVETGTREMLGEKVKLILDSIKKIQKKTTALISEIETQSRRPVESQEGDTIEMLKLELLDETFGLHDQLARMDAYLNLRMKSRNLECPVCSEDRDRWLKKLCR